MESLGEKLRVTREEKGISHDQVARETHITRQYIVALEEEDFSVFPGEPYLIGFLRNYAEYLGLDAEEMVNLYKNMQIQEQPIPMDELLHNKKGMTKWIFVLLVLIIVGGLGGGGTYLYINELPPFAPAAPKAANHDEEKSSENSKSAKGATYVLEDQMMEKRFYLGDIVRIPVSDNTYTVRLNEISDSVNLSMPSGSVVLELGGEQILDLNSDAEADVRVALRDIDPEDSSKGVVLRFSKVVQSPGKVATAEQGNTETSIGNTNEPDRKEETKVILRQEEKEPFTVDIVFRGYCLVRYKADKKERQEQYFQKGETLRLEATDRLMLWVSNAGSLKPRIKGRDIELGEPGEVVAKLLTWKEGEEQGNYRLELIPVY